MDEQLALVARLKVAFGRASEREAAEEVLRSLLNRHDLYQLSAREIESLLSPLNRQVPRPQRQEAPNARLRESSARQWSVNQIVREPACLRLELRKYDSHTLEWRRTGELANPVILDGKTVAKYWFNGTKTFEFEDGGEKVTAEITLVASLMSGKLKSGELKLDNELVYHFP